MHSHKQYKEGEEVKVWGCIANAYGKPFERYSYDSLKICNPNKEATVTKMKTNFGESILGMDYLLLNISLRFPSKSDQITTTTTEATDNTAVLPLPTKFSNHYNYVQECRAQHTKDEIDHLRAAVRENYWYKLTIDGLPLWGQLGTTDVNPGSGATEEYIFTHRSIRLSYNSEGYIVDASVDTSGPVLLADYAHKSKKLGPPLAMTYNVTWKMSHVSPQARTAAYYEPRYFEHSGHTLAVVASLFLAACLTGTTLIVLLRVRQTANIKPFGEIEEVEGLSLRGKSPNSDLKHNDDDDVEQTSSSYSSSSSPNAINPAIGECEPAKRRAAVTAVIQQQEESAFFSALLGTGAQFLVTLVLLCGYGAMSKAKYFYRGDFAECAIYIYATASNVGGICAGWYCHQDLPYHHHRHRQHHKQQQQQQRRVNWLWSCVLTFTMYPALFAVMWAVLTVCAAKIKSSMAVPFRTHFTLFLIWVFLVVPFTVVGFVFSSIIFRKTPFTNKISNNNSIANKIKNINKNKESVVTAVTTLPWGTILVGGAVIFGSIFTELHFVHSALWGYKIFYTYGYALCALVCLVVVSGCTGALCTYCCCFCAQKQHQNHQYQQHRWHWVAFLTGAAAGVYTLVYSGGYFVAHAVRGLFFAGVYCMVSVTLALAVGLICGFSGYVFSLAFVKALCNTEKRE